MDIIDIKEALSEYEIFPTQISQMKVKNPRNDSHTNFLLTFNATENITTEKLGQVRSNGFLRVRIDRYYGDGNPPQCPRCLHWSHGSSFCGMPPRFCKCGDNHASNVCPLRINQNDPKFRIPDDKVRCANCNGNHPANYKGCKKLQTYKETYILKQRVSNNKGSKPSNTPVYNTPAYHRHLTQLPSTSSTNSRPSTINGRSWAEVTSSEPTEELFTTAQMLEIVNKIQSRIKSCRTRSEQIMTIIEYLSNYSPLVKHKRELRILYLNAHDINDKIHEIYDFLIVNDVDIACICQMFLKPHVNLPGHPD